MDAQDHPMSHYPALRLRRPRASGWSRRLHAETVLTPADLVWPLFVVEGEGVEQPVASLPGVSRWSVDGIVTRAKEARDLGIPCVALFRSEARRVGKGCVRTCISRWARVH